MTWRMGLCLAIALTAFSAGVPGDAGMGRASEAAATTPAAGPDRPEPLAALVGRLLGEGPGQASGRGSEWRVATGAECPVRSGKYCSDKLPWCCVAADGTSYCAKDTTGCTK